MWPGLAFMLLWEISGLIYVGKGACMLQRRCAAHPFRLHASEGAACNIKESFCLPSECHVSSGLELGDCLWCALIFLLLLCTLSYVLLKLWELLTHSPVWLARCSMESRIILWPLRRKLNCCPNRDLTRLLLVKTAPCSFRTGNLAFVLLVVFMWRRFICRFLTKKRS